MNSFVIGMGGVTLVILVLVWVMPNFVDPQLPFGVRIPPERIHDAVLKTARRRYYTGQLVSTLICAALWIWCAVGIKDVRVMAPILALLPFIALIVSSTTYFIVHRFVHAAKTKGNWMAGHKQVIVVETDKEKYRQPVSWWWSVPTWIVIVGGLVVGIIWYPHIPRVFPVHYDASGHVNRWAVKSIGSVFTFWIVQFLTGVFMSFLHVRLQRTQALVNPAYPEASAQANAKRTARMVRAAWMLFFFLNLSLLWTNFAIWQLVKADQGGRLLGTMLPLLPGIIMILMAGRPRRVDAQAGEAQSHAPVPPDDDNYWFLGGLYINRNDSRLLVEKRFGIGWTLNFGHPASWVFIAVIVLAAILIPIFVAH